MYCQLKTEFEILEGHQYLEDTWKKLARKQWTLTYCHLLSSKKCFSYEIITSLLLIQKFNFHDNKSLMQFFYRLPAGDLHEGEIFKMHIP